MKISHLIFPRPELSFLLCLHFRSIPLDTTNFRVLVDDYIAQRSELFFENQNVQASECYYTVDIERQSSHANPLVVMSMMTSLLSCHQIVDVPSRHSEGVVQSSQDLKFQVCS